jgi:hypothetical protein
MPDRTKEHPPRLESEIQDFLVECHIRKVSKKTMVWHKGCLKHFAEFCYVNEVTAPKYVTASHLRRFIMLLDETGHNTGGIANIYRSVKASL